MKIKKFTAGSFCEALELVKQELGRDAIILSSEEKRDKKGVEITAAVDYEFADVEDKIGNTQFSTDTAGHENNELQSLRKELLRIRDTLEEMKNYGYELSLPAGRRRVFYYLKERAFRDEFALRLCEKAATVEDIAERIFSEIQVRNTDYTGKAVMVVGPTGVGKTTTVAKLSAYALKKGRRVGIINLDTYRIGAIEQIRIYARVLGIPLVVASDATQLKEALIDFSKDRDVVFIDTVGRRPSDRGYITEMCQTIKEVQHCRDKEHGFSLEVHLLMAANTDEDVLVEAFRYYRNLPVDYLAFTKTDEATRFGGLYNLLLLYQKPVAYITTGQTVPDDIEFVDRRSLAGLILRKGNLLTELEV